MFLKMQDFSFCLISDIEARAAYPYLTLKITKGTIKRAIPTITTRVKAENQTENGLRIATDKTDPLIPKKRRLVECLCFSSLLSSGDKATAIRKKLVKEKNAMAILTGKVSGNILKKEIIKNGLKSPRTNWETVKDK